jgi:hypothetical protein
MSFKSMGSASSEVISRFEAEIGFGLPNAFRTFLLRHNGGVFTGDYPTLVIPNLAKVCVGVLFGLEAPDSLSLQFWFRRYRDETPPNSLLIGGDPGGAFYLLVCNGSDRGVYFYDHAHELPSSSNERNTYMVSSDFGTFAGKVGLPG